MIPLKNISILSVFVLTVLLAPACKAKKPLGQNPTPAAPPAKTITSPVEAPRPEPVKEEPAPTPPPAPAADYNFSNIQFEFNSAVLKTSAYTILDKASRELKKDPSVKFILNGYASAEGSDEHNLSLSQERANAVKTYLVNSGVNGDILKATGFGEKNPISKNTDEASRAVNRRVEIRKL